MAKNREIIFNCGISHLSASVFSSGVDTLVLEKVGLHTLSYDYTQEKDWLEAVVSGIKLLSDDLKLKGQARFIFPGSFLLTKTIRVPRVEKDKQDKIVEFELSQKMPFPLADLIWDYQVIDDDGVEQEILAFAVKPEVAESFCEKLIELGLSPVQITPAPILDYNALRSSGIGLDESEILVVNMGAKSTNLLFINPTGFLIRSIAVGGNALTQNLADRLGILFEKAEEVKKSYFSGQMALSPEDPNLQNIESCAQQFLARASQEITRSIVTYKRLKKGKSPERIYLAGRGALLRNLPEYISQSQQLSIDYFDPTKTLQVGNGVSSEMKGLLPFMLSEPIGLASTLLSDDKSKGFAQVINLLPSSKISSLGFRKKKPYLCLAAMLFAILPFPSLLNTWNNKDQLEKVLAKEKSTTKDLQSELSETELEHEKFLFADRLSKVALEKNIPFAEKQKRGWQMQHLLNELQGTLDHLEVKDTWFDSLKLIVVGSEEASRRNVIQSPPNRPPEIELKLSGRYLVRASEEELMAGDNEKRNTLIDLNSKKQEALTAYLEGISSVKKINRKVFSIEGKGDLFGKYFTHFEYEITTNF